MGKNALGWCLPFYAPWLRTPEDEYTMETRAAGPHQMHKFLSESGEHGDTQALPVTRMRGDSVAVSQAPSLLVWKGSFGRRPGLLVPLLCLVSVSHFRMVRGCWTNACAAARDMCGLHRPCSPGGAGSMALDSQGLDHL